MEHIKHFIDHFIHLDHYVGNLTNSCGNWTYVVVFAIIFCETGLVVVPFLGLMLAILQVAMIALAQGELETATESAVRSILTGQAQASNMTQNQFTQLVCANLTPMFSCGNVMVDVQTAGAFGSANTAAPTITYSSQGAITNTWQYQPGTTGSIVVARVMYQWPLLLGPLGLSLTNMSNGNHLLMATAVFENEPQ